MDESRLSINSQANQTGISWTIDTIEPTQGTIDYEAMTIDREYGSAPSWTNSISYRESELQLSMSSVDSWYKHVCGINENGNVYCWGENGRPIRETYQLPEDYHQILVSFDDDNPSYSSFNWLDNSCILTDESRVMCWGDGSKGTKRARNLGR